MKSALSQDCIKFELIVVDDDSKEHSNVALSALLARIVSTLWSMLRMSTHRPPKVVG